MIKEAAVIHFVADNLEMQGEKTTEIDKLSLCINISRIFYQTRVGGVR